MKKYMVEAETMIGGSSGLRHYRVNAYSAFEAREKVKKLRGVVFIKKVLLDK